MAYLFFIDDILLPVSPPKLEMSMDNKNKTLTLINEGEINILKNPGLMDISFEVLLPNVLYPFANYEERFHGAEFYLEKLRLLKEKKKTFQFIVTRDFPETEVVNGEARSKKLGGGDIKSKLTLGGELFTTNRTVTLEEYKIIEDAKDGFDIVVSIKLKQYRYFGANITNISEDGTKLSKEKTRETSKAPKAESTTTYKAVKGDTLWAIAKRNYGDGTKYTILAEKNKITDPNYIKVGQVLTIPVLQ